MERNEFTQNDITKEEREKYIKAWNCGAEGQSRTAFCILNYIKDRLNKNWNILDLGCGNGIVVELLRQKGFKNVFGTDITMEGLKYNVANPNYNQNIDKFVPQSKNYVQSTIWNLPFKDNSFDCTFSVDVLEHMPSEMIEKTINEIYRITSKETLHCIATFKDIRKGFDFHLTIEPIELWKELFNKLNLKNIKTEIIDRTEFLRKNIPNYLGK